mgnify:CR=1 FL=1
MPFGLLWAPLGVPLGSLGLPWRLMGPSWVPLGRSASTFRLFGLFWGVLPSNFGSVQGNFPRELLVPQFVFPGFSLQTGVVVGVRFRVM